MSISLENLVHDLDTLFSVRHWDADPGMSRFMPQVYQGIGCDHARLFEADFCARHNGLMLRSSETVQTVYLAAFPSPDVLDAILSRPAGEALLFLHHPIDMEVSDAGFLPIPPSRVEHLKEHGVSIYACHAPMDCHPTIGTTASIVEAFGVQVEQAIAKYGEGFAGAVGSITPIVLNSFIEMGKRVFGVDRVEVGGAEPSPVTRVAIVAGAGNDPEVFKEAEDLGAQVYVTGDWYFRSRRVNEPGWEWAAQNRSACLDYADSTAMALLGYSHAATEFLVMKTQMADYFRNRGLQAECVEQEDWWR